MTFLLEFQQCLEHKEKNLPSVGFSDESKLLFTLPPDMPSKMFYTKYSLRASQTIAKPD